MAKKKPMRTVVIGSLGIVPDNLTLETVRELRSCGKLFVVPDLRRFPGAKLNKRIEAIGGLSPARQAKKVLSALTRHRKAGVLTYGSPAFLCGVAAELRAACRGREDVELRILDAVSSFDAILGFLCVKGIASPTCLEYRVMSCRSRVLELDRRVPALICEAHGAKKADLRRLLAAVRKTYPASHPVHLAACLGPGSKLVTCRASDLEAALRTAGPETTLYIPEG